LQTKGLVMYLKLVKLKPSTGSSRTVECVLENGFTQISVDTNHDAYANGELAYIVRPTDLRHGIEIYLNPDSHLGCIEYFIDQKIPEPLSTDNHYIFDLIVEHGTPCFDISEWDSLFSPIQLFLGERCFWHHNHLVVLFDGIEEAFVRRIRFGANTDILLDVQGRLGGVTFLDISTSERERINIGGEQSLIPVHRGPFYL
jgi:hypothetical protein